MALIQDHYRRAKFYLSAGLVMLALLTGCSSGDTDPGEMPGGPTAEPATPARTDQQLEAWVTAEVFSGRPNPEWVLSPAESDELSQRMGFLAVTAAGPPPQGLGYRGVVVRVEATNSVGAASLRAYGKTIYYTVEDLETGVPNTTALHDASGTLESWLLSTGEPHIDAETYAAVAEVIATAHPDIGEMGEEGAGSDSTIEVDSGAAEEATSTGAEPPPATSTGAPPSTIEPTPEG